MLAHVCRGNVAVVGNGRLTREDRERINGPEFDCIVRFNDRKNLQQGERTTVHAVRDIPDSNVSFLSRKFRGEQRIIPGLVPREEVFVQPVTARPDRIWRRFENTTTLPPILVQEDGGTVASDDMYFPECDKCKDGTFECNPSATSMGPSTGTVLINALEAQSSTSAIHVFGMNWNGGDHHIDFKQPELVSVCCTKCDIHPTASSDYV